MTTKDRDKVSDDAGAQMTAFAQEFRGSLILEALAGACAIISYADGQSSLIEQWRFSKVLADDPLLAAMPETAFAEDWAMHRQAFITDPKAAREAASLLVA